MPEIILSPSQDAFIESLNPTNSNGDSSSIRIGEDNDSLKKYRALIQFDLSSIPFDATIISAEVSLYRWLEKSDHSRSMGVYRVKQDWVDSEASWNNFSAGNAWETPGCGGSNDRELTAIGSQILDSSYLGWIDFQLDAASIQEMLTEGNFQNRGFLLMNDIELDDSSRFFSLEYTTDLTKLPKLVITYETPNPELNPIGLKLIPNSIDILFFETSVRLRAQRRNTFLKTRKKGSL